jgi:hypothetical protein
VLSMFLVDETVDLSLNCYSKYYCLHSYLSIVNAVLAAFRAP